MNRVGWEIERENQPSRLACLRRDEGHDCILQGRGPRHKLHDAQAAADGHHIIRPHLRNSSSSGRHLRLAPTHGCTSTSTSTSTWRTSMRTGVPSAEKGGTCATLHQPMRRPRACSGGLSRSADSGVSSRAVCKPYPTYPKTLTNPVKSYCLHFKP